MGQLVGEVVRLGFLFTLVGVGIWIGGASVAAWVAWEKGREPVAWFVLAFFLSPLLALVALSAVPPLRHQRARIARRSGRRPLEDPVVAAARLVDGLHREDKRWDVATSAETTTKRAW
ncbi:MAG TPA: hypothetical protein VJ794_00870 [Gemmatimonadales bacterium]|nr:hypothetical protein [Gemmatimonadales bacterium]